MEWIKLDLQLFAGEKTEKATPKKRQDSRKKGQVAKSQDVNTAIVLLAVFLTLLFAGQFFFESLLNIFKHSYQQYIGLNVTENNLRIILLDILQELVFVLAPIMAVAMIAGVAANYMQFGFLFSTETIQPKLEKLDPIKGFKRIFSLRAIVELLKSILKISLVGLATFSVLWFRKEEILILAQKSLGAGITTIANLTVQMGLIASILLIVLSILDYLYQKYDFEKNIKMSKQDIKDEHKNIEGDPLIKSKIKQRQREMAMRRMMQEVPNADVVITNPTHYAVCLKYDESKLDAPFVVAKGVDYVAQKIKYIAKENDVVLVENRPLARALYSQTEIGDAIPEEFFKAVAEILAYVYRAKNKI
ncbi:flagellar biosynthetic protein FlhB [Robertmurraya siralis]|uniref:Flagellar biosynthetic protein FlhB n=1 Tax=Robertmurraya siralis TaxID=77777 RepID=A0A919WGX4_9BACI|nr:flagellar biosynthesis protein FlhB [Robertmurraya siralis]PAE21404.1 flagellar biosynthesis protein FlhB [Bacillus sp. 7504-2]GIN61542.1 flagellar biosynthetic protein FlhB [Robertmurraya siralis]